MKTKTKEQTSTFANFKVRGSANAVRNSLIKNSEKKQLKTAPPHRPGCGCC
jgi:hypothetical protein